MSQPTIASRYTLPSEIGSTSGSYANAVRQTFQCKDTYWNDAGVSDKMGHRYLCLNSLGVSKVMPVDLMNKVKANLGAVFPGGATGGRGPNVVIGQVFSLTAMKFKVKVIAADAWSFTLRTEFWHPLIGTARHGIFKDSSGELWLLQEGMGEHRESMVRIAVNYWRAPVMWKDMAASIKRLYL